LVAAGLLAAVTFVTGSPIPALTGAGLLTLAGLFQLVPPVGSVEAEREVDSVRTVEGGDVVSRARLDGTLRVPGVITLDDEPPAIAEIQSPGRRTHLGVGAFALEGDTEMTLPVRGVADIGPLTAFALDPLGLVSHRFEALPPDSVHVWPRGEDADEQPLRARYERMLSGRHNVPNPGESLEFYGIREYQPSDPMRKVNWNQTAAKGEMLVNENEQQTYGEVAVFVDARRITGIGTHRENPLHEVCRFATTLGNIAYATQDVMRAYAFGPADFDRFRPDPGSPWKDQYNDWLTELEPAGDLTVEPVLDEVLPYLTERSIVVFITPLFDDDVIGDAAHRAMALENDVLVIATGLPDSLPDAIQDSLDEDREDRLANLRDRGVPVIDAAAGRTLEQAIDEQEAMM